MLRETAISLDLEKDYRSDFLRKKFYLEYLIKIPIECSCYNYTMRSEVNIKRVVFENNPSQNHR